MERKDRRNDLSLAKWIKLLTQDVAFLMGTIEGQGFDFL